MGFTPKERGLSRKIELLKTVYDGVLAHEVAHVVTDDGLLLAVSAAKQVVHPQIVEKIKAYDQKMLNVESMPKELRDEIKELIRKETISLTGIEDFSQNEEEQFNTYFSLYFPEKASLGNTKHIHGLHNIMIDIYIENALPTILPQRMFDEKGKIVGDDMRTRHRKALMTARELVTPRKNYLDYGDPESLLIKSMGGMAALEKMLFSIIGPYVDAR